jgi:hypothetical protein
MQSAVFYYQNIKQGSGSFLDLYSIGSAGKKGPPKNGKNKEISCFRASLEGWRLIWSLEISCEGFLYKIVLTVNFLTFSQKTGSVRIRIGSFILHQNCVL